MKSVFMDKEKQPGLPDLKKALGATFNVWQELASYALKAYPAASSGWHFSGAAYGWSFRIRDKKRVLLYLLPRDGFFKVAFVFGQKAVDQVLDSEVPEFFKEELKNARAYAEGRGIRIELWDKALMQPLKKLIEIKINN
jgi:hypothetical protein